MSSLTKPNRWAYNFGKILGVGAFGIVREANGPEGKCAVKIIRKDNVRGNEQAVYCEVAMLRNMDNPHIIKFHEWFESKVRLARPKTKTPSLECSTGQALYYYRTRGGRRALRSHLWEG